MVTAARDRVPKTRKARHVRQDERAHTNFFNSNTSINTTETTRLQFLIASCGLSGPRANLIAALAWGDAA